MRNPIQDSDNKKEKAECLFIDAESVEEPVRQESIGEKATAGRVYSKERRYAADKSSGGCAHNSPCRLQLRCSAGFDMTVEEQVQRRRSQIQSGIGQKHPPICGQDICSGPVLNRNGKRSR